MTSERAGNGVAQRCQITTHASPPNSRLRTRDVRVELQATGGWQEFAYAQR